MAAIPQYASTPRIGAATLTSADTSLSNPTTVSTVITGGTSGTRVEKLGIKSLGNSISGIVRWFLYDGSSYTLLTERLIPVTTSGNTSVCFEETLNSLNSPDLLPIHLPNNTWSIRATTTVAQVGLRARVEGADL